MGFDFKAVKIYRNGGKSIKLLGTYSGDDENDRFVYHITYCSRGVYILLHVHV